MRAYEQVTINRSNSGRKHFQYSCARTKS